MIIRVHLFYIIHYISPLPSKHPHNLWVKLEVNQRLALIIVAFVLLGKWA
jgi:hypothetical protein